MKKAHRNKGFTLIELLVAVALMLVLVGGVARIFKHTSDAMLLADATMTTTQNARAMMEIMARDLASVQVGDSPAAADNFLVQAPANGTSFIEFDTIASWWDSANSNAGEGVARVRYQLVQSAADVNRWSMMRGLRINGNWLDEPVTQYVMADGGTPRLRIEYYYWDTNNMSGNYMNNTLFVEPNAANHPQTGNAVKTFYENNLPSSVRLSIDLTDRRRDVIRHYSQVFWIATGTGRAME